MKSTEIARLLSDIHDDTIAAICDLIKEKGAIEIDFNHGPMYQYVDDQFSEVIGRVNTEIKMVWIDTGTDMYPVPLNDLSTELLLAILEKIEDDEFEIMEEFEEKLTQKYLVTFTILRGYYDFENTNPKLHDEKFEVEVPEDDGENGAIQIAKTKLVEETDFDTTDIYSTKCTTI